MLEKRNSLTLESTNATTGRPSLVQQTVILFRLYGVLQWRQPLFVIAAFVTPFTLLWFNNAGFSRTVPYNLTEVDMFLPGLLTTLTWLFYNFIFLVPVVNEYVTELRRGLFLNGVRRQAYWWRYTFNVSLQVFVGSFLYLLCSSLTRIWTKTNVAIVLISFMLSLQQLVPVWTLIAMFSKRNLHANIMAIPLLFIPSLIFIGYYYGSVSSYWIGALLTCLGGGGAITYQLGQIAIYESIDENSAAQASRGGVQWSNVWESGIAISWIVQVVTTVAIYCALVHKLRARKRTSTRTTSDRSTEERSNPQNDRCFESLPRDAQAAISIRGVKKTYGGSGAIPLIKTSDPVTAVDNLDMTVMQGEVFGFLGHNGAGKSTTVSILSSETGFDRGHIQFNFRDGEQVALGEGRDDEVIERIGVCPQSDFLFSDFTCREHLQWFALLKGCVPVTNTMTDEEAVDSHIQSLIEKLQFTSDSDEDRKIKEYSGGMKRKVSLAISMLGDPEILFMDEPTAGMDPYNRRKMWDMIIDMKQGRTILLTTHFMDEADILSDRVGVIKAGKMVTCGTSLFLKHVFGAGYTLTLEASEGSDAADPVNMRDVLLKHVAAASLSHTETIGEKLETKRVVTHWQIPYGNEDALAVLLQSIGRDGFCKVLALDNTTLEQVFLKTGAENIGANFGDEKADALSAPEGEKSNSKGDSVVVSFAEGSGNDTVVSADDIRLFWSGTSIARTGGVFSKTMAVTGLVFTSSWPTLICVYFVLYPLVFIILGFVMLTVIDPFAASVSLPWALCALFIGVALGPMLMVIQTFGELTEQEFFSVIRLLGVSRTRSYISLQLSVHCVNMLVVYVITMIASLAFGSNLTTNVYSWILTTIALLLLVASFSPYLGIIGFFMKTKKIGSLVSSVLSSATHVLFVIFFVVGMFASPQVVEILVYCLSIMPSTAGQLALYHIGVGGHTYDPNTGVTGSNATFSVLLAWDSYIVYAYIIMLAVGTLGWIVLLVLLHTADKALMASSEDVREVQYSEPDVQEFDAVALQGTSVLNAVRLYKSFRLKDDKVKEAVKAISIPVQKNSILGLLGPNGAGKTQLMKMCTGNLAQDAGRIRFGSESGVCVGMQTFFSEGRCGYVPQTDALWMASTVMQHLDFACRTKGLDTTSTACVEHVNAVARVLGLDQHLDKRAKDLSGGYKRKLCLAIAVVGTPDLLMLDEVTTGMDPGARHEIWSVLKPQVADVQIPAILLSTHYLDEAEYLSQNVGIMVDGEMVAAGSLQKVSDKYGTYNQLQIYLSEDAECSQQEAKEKILTRFSPGSFVTEHVLNKVVIKVPRNASATLGEQLGGLFATMQELAKDTSLGISYYSVAKMSLEQIFMELCAKQFKLNAEQEL